MWQAVKDELFTAIESGFPSTSVHYDAPDYEMLHNLRYNAATFAAFKNHDEVKKIQELLMDGDKPRKWKDFRDQALQISEQYNRRWLQTEYNHAMQSSRMARRWNDAVKTADLYPNLKYVAVQDERTRHDHKMLHGAVYPIGDSFWDTHYPPNGWGCRCTVRPTDAPVKEAESFPVVPEMFRNNPGKTGVIFPDNNPFAAAASGAEKEAIEKFVKENAINTNVFKISKDVKTIQDLNEVMAEFAKLRPGYFAHGFKGIQPTKKLGVNGSTDRRGNISLNNTKMQHIIEAFGNIRKNVPLSFDQEDALSTLWHEINHNRNGIPAILDNGRDDGPQRRFMETSNEFVSRKTFSKFLEDFGVKLQNPELINNRASTGYNTWVRNFEKIINHTGADIDKVLEDVSKHLFNEIYSDQKTGLVNSIMNNMNGKFGKKDVMFVVKYTITSLDEDMFENFMKRNLLEKKK